MFEAVQQLHFRQLVKVGCYSQLSFNRVLKHCSVNTVVLIACLKRNILTPTLAFIGKNVEANASFTLKQLLLFSHYTPLAL